MAQLLRIRCPACGGLVHQNMLNVDHELEFIIQRVRGLGRGRGWRNEFERAKVTAGLVQFAIHLAGRLRQVAQRLEVKALLQACSPTIAASYASGPSASSFGSPSLRAGEIALDFNEERCAPEQKQVLRAIKERLMDGAATRYNFER